MKIPNFYLEDMIDAIEKIDSYLRDTTEIHFSQDTELQDAVIRRLMIVGEAARQVPDDVRALAPDVPWKTIIAFRNVVIHDYANVSLGRVWEIYKQDLPVLMPKLRALLAKLPNPEK